MGVAPGLFCVGFGGSRSLPSVGASGGLVARVVASLSSLARPGASVSVFVGCCSGADAAVLSAALPWSVSAPPGFAAVRVFAAFGPGGVGSWRCSAVPLVLSAASAPRCLVRWWAGGGASVPLVARLRARSRALASALPVGSSAFVAFFGPGSSRGTAGSCRAAVARGVPVFAFPVGRSSLPSLGAGSWVAVGGSGVWASAFRWVPAA